MIAGDILTALGSGPVHVSAAAKKVGLPIPELQHQVAELEAAGEIERRPGGYLLRVTPEQRQERRAAALERARAEKRRAQEAKEEERREQQRKMLLGVMKVQFPAAPATMRDLTASPIKIKDIPALVAELVADGRLVKCGSAYLLPGAAARYQEHLDRVALERELQEEGAVRK